MNAIQKILVPTDLSELSLTALEYVLATKQFKEVKIYFMYVVDEKQVHGHYEVDVHTVTSTRDSFEKAAYDLDRLVFRKAYGRNISPIVRRGDVHKEIVEFAREEGVDLIVMATHGRTGFAHVLMGSVAEKVVRHSPVPVLTVKPESLWSNVLEENDVEEQLHLKQ